MGEAMRTIHSLLPTAVAATTASLLILLAGPAAAQSVAWDQDKVTELAEKLTSAVKDLKLTMRKAPEQPRGTARRAQGSALEDVRLLESSCKRLSTQLKGGAGHDQTWPIFKRMQTLRRDLEQNAGKAMISETTMSKIVPARDLMGELEPYYSKE